MTGHGDAIEQRNGIAVAVEVRTINNRYFKLTVRADDRYAALESQIEDVVRQFVRRGTVQVGLRIDRRPNPDEFRLNEVVLLSYLSQVNAIRERYKRDNSAASGPLSPVEVSSFLLLPGVVDESGASRPNLDSEWELIQTALKRALEKLGQMRRDEGRAMAEDLLLNRQLIRNQLTAIEWQAPQLVENYRTRLTERVNRILSEFQVEIQAIDVVREIAILADRTDISEEIVRLRTHLDQFEEIIGAPESNGRKLEFLTQEMLRETNTIGSKANDAQIAKHVIEIKTSIERIREMIQNVE